MADLRVGGGTVEPQPTERRDAAAALEDLEIPTWAEGGGD